MLAMNFLCFWSFQSSAGLKNVSSEETIESALKPLQESRLKPVFVKAAVSSCVMLPLYPLDFKKLCCVSKSGEKIKPVSSVPQSVISKRQRVEDEINVGDFPGALRLGRFHNPALVPSQSALWVNFEALCLLGASSGR